MLGVERIEVLLKPMVGRHTSVDDATNRLDRPFFTAQEASREGSRWLMEGPWCRVRRENGSKIQTTLTIRHLTTAIRSKRVELSFPHRSHR
jgi:hypothetical protein